MDLSYTCLNAWARIQTCTKPGHDSIFLLIWAKSIKNAFERKCNLNWDSFGRFWAFFRTMQNWWETIRWSNTGSDVCSSLIVLVQISCIGIGTAHCSVVFSTEHFWIILRQRFKTLKIRSLGIFVAAPVIDRFTPLFVKYPFDPPLCSRFVFCTVSVLRLFAKNFPLLGFFFNYFSGDPSPHQQRINADKAAIEKDLQRQQTPLFLR